MVLIFAPNDPCHLKSRVPPLGSTSTIPILSQYSCDETVHSPLFFSKIVEIEGFALRLPLRECQTYLGGGAGAVWEEARKIEGL